jgi:hypothetical protein
MAKEVIPHESAEQRALFVWAKMQSGKYPELDLMYHIPNEGKRSRYTGQRMRAEGLKTGVPDICLPCARGAYHGLYIELKRRKGGTVSENQSEWIDALNKAGYMATVCKGFEEAVNAIMEYLTLKEGEK